MRKLANLINRLSTFFLDMDGVLYRGEAPIGGAAQAVAYLRRKGKKIVFMTNNAAYTRRAYVHKLARMGIPARESEIITSGYAAVLYLRKRAPHARLYVVGEPGLKAELRQGGFEVLPDNRAGEVDFVVAGLDRTLTYNRLEAGVRALLAGAELIATNLDATYPTETGLSPGAGATVGALSGSSGKQPKVVIGKPSPNMIKLALRMAGSRPKETAILGDKLATDIRAGREAGLTTILVLTGVTSKRDLKKAKGTRLAPDIVLSSITDLVVGK